MWVDESTEDRWVWCSGDGVCPRPAAVVVGGLLWGRGSVWAFPSPKAAFRYQCDRTPKRRLVRLACLVPSRGCGRSCPAGIREVKGGWEEGEKNGKEGCKEVEAFGLSKKTTVIAPNEQNNERLPTDDGRRTTDNRQQTTVNKQQTIEKKKGECVDHTPSVE